MALPAALVAAVPSLVQKAIEIFDKKFQTDAEKSQAEFQFGLALQERLQAAWDNEQANLTARHQADMQSDSWLSKNIRPMTLIYLMALFTVAFFTEVPENVLELLRDLLMTAFVFYFGARTVEKVVDMMVGRRKGA